MKQIIRMCYEHNIDLATEIRKYIKALPKDKKTGAYNGNQLLRSLQKGD